MTQGCQTNRLPQHVAQRRAQGLRPPDQPAGVLVGWFVSGVWEGNRLG